jgi:hypothetical protein
MRETERARERERERERESIRRDIHATASFPAAIGPAGKIHSLLHQEKNSGHCSYPPGSS